MVEVEAGPVPQGFFEACTMSGVETLCIAVRNDYRSSDVFSKVCTFLISYTPAVGWGFLSVDCRSLVIDVCSDRRFLWKNDKITKRKPVSYRIFHIKKFAIF